MVTHLFDKYQGQEAWLEAGHKSYCNEEMSTSTQKEEDVEDIAAQYASKLQHPPPDPPRWTAFEDPFTTRKV